jgi:hypothetical protein
MVAAIGKDGAFDVKFLEAALKEGPFLALLQAVTSEVHASYMVPPLHGGQWDKTKFDSVEEQNRFFYESVFIPRCEDLQKFCQRIQDDYLYALEAKDLREVRLTKSMAGRLDRARSDSGGSVLVALDIDHIPAVAQLRDYQLTRASRLIEVAHLTPRAACEAVGLELELNRTADFVWYKNDQKFVDPLTVKAEDQDYKAAPALEDPTKAAAAKAPNPEPAAPPKAEPVEKAAQTPEELEARTEQLREFFVGLRTLSLECADQKGIWTLSQADGLAKELGLPLFLPIRAAFTSLRPICHAGNKEAVRSYFNKAMKHSALKTLAVSLDSPQ